jgi:hypothetical protein
MTCKKLVELTVLQSAIRDRHLDDVCWAAELLDRDRAGTQARLNMCIFSTIAVILFALSKKLISKGICIPVTHKSCRVVVRIARTLKRMDCMSPLVFETSMTRFFPLFMVQYVPASV